MNGLCRELMSTLLEAGAAVAKDYLPKGGERNGGTHTKRIVTLFGETEPIARTYYYDTGARAGHCPFDERLGLAGRYTPAAAREIMRQTVNHPFREAAEEFSRTHGFSISADTARSIVGMHGKAAQDYVRSGDGIGREDARGGVPLACVMADGTGIPMRKSSLCGVKGKNGRAKTREVKAGAVFIASKTSDNKPHRNLDTTTYVATTHKKEKFGKMLRREFDRRFGQLPETTPYITDGGKWLHSIHQGLFPFAIEMLDVYHAVEHLEPLMLGMGFRKGTKEWRNKYAYWKKRVKDGKIASVLKTIWNRHRDKLGKEAMKEYKYFRSNAGRMKYDGYRANGWFIGSGVIESGCKTVIGQRFKQSGMIWSLKGVKALLPLRTLHKSNRLEEFFLHLVKDLPQVDCVA